MKRFSFFSILLLSLISICYGDPNIYKDRTNGYEFNIPDGYNHVVLDEDRDNIDAKFINKENNVIFYGFDDLYSMMASEDKGNTGRTELSFNTFTDSDIEEFGDSVISQFPKIRIIRGDIIKINLLKAYRCRCRTIYDGQTMYGTLMLFLKNGQITYFQFFGKESTDESIIDEVTQSFTMTKETNGFSISGILKQKFGLSSLDSDTLLYISIILSFIITWSIGVIPPLIIRRWIFRGPIPKIKALVLTIFFYLAQLMFWSVLNPNGRHGVLFFIALITYGILHNGYDSSKSKFKVEAVNGNGSSAACEEHTAANDEIETNYSEDQRPIPEQITSLDANNHELEPIITTDYNSNNSKYDNPENIGVNLDNIAVYEDSVDLLDGQANDKRESISSLEERFSSLQVLFDKGLITKEDYDKKKKELLDLI